MLFWILQSMILSIIFILVVHHLIHFFKTTLTIPKMKDLVNAPTQKYDNIYNIIGSLPQSPDSSSAISFLPQSQPQTPSANSDTSSFLMKNELKHFLKTQLNH